MSPSRSELMARIKDRDTKPEILLRRALWREGLRYRVRARTPVGRPDLVFPGPLVAVYIDGCFWHGCPAHYSRPRSRTDFWSCKLTENLDRDRRQTLALEALGWRVVRLWECDVLDRIEHCVHTVRAAVTAPDWTPPPTWRVAAVEPLAPERAPARGPIDERRDLVLLRDPTTGRSESGPRVTAKASRR